MDVLLTSWQESEEVVEKGPPPDVVLRDLRPVPHPEAVLDEHEAVFVPHQVEQINRITDDVEEEPRGEGLEALLCHFNRRSFFETCVRAAIILPLISTSRVESNVVGHNSRKPKLMSRSLAMVETILLARAALPHSSDKSQD